MKEKLEELNEQVTKHSRVIFYVVGGILSLTVAFGLGQCTAPVDREALCKTYKDDADEAGRQLAECRRLKVSDCDARLRECHEQERAACQESLNQFRERCEELACQE